MLVKPAENRREPWKFIENSRTEYGVTEHEEQHDHYNDEKRFRSWMFARNYRSSHARLPMQ